MTYEVYRDELASIARVYTVSSFFKVNQASEKIDSQKAIYVNKKVVRDGVQARTESPSEGFSYVVVLVDDRLDPEYLAFLLNSSPWKVMLGNGNKFLEGMPISTSLSTLNKTPIVLLTNEGQSSCSFLNTLITSAFDAIEQNVADDGFKKVYRFLQGLRDYIAMEILLDGVLSSQDISVLSAWVDKKMVYDKTQNKKEALVALLKSIFSPNDELRDRMNKMRLYIDENTDVVFNQFPK